LLQGSAWAFHQGVLFGSSFDDTRFGASGPVGQNDQLIQRPTDSGLRQQRKASMKLIRSTGTSCCGPIEA